MNGKSRKTDESRDDGSINSEDNSSTEYTYKPNFPYLILFGGWAVTFPVATVLTYITGDKYLMYILTYSFWTMFIIGGFLWLACVLGLWIVYDAMVNPNRFGGDA